MAMSDVTSDANKLWMINDYKRPDECETEWEAQMAEVLILLHQMYLEEEVARRKSRKSGRAQRVAIESKP